MKRKYTLPVIAALVFHAALLFGIPGTPAPEAIVNEEPQVIALEPMPPPMSVPDYAIHQEESEEAREAKLGDSDVMPPSLPDAPKPAALDDFVIDMQEAANSPIQNMERINPGIFGVTDGKIDGISLKPDSISLSDLDNSPRARTQPAPLYPGEAKIRGLEGQVVLGFTVNEDGRVESPYVISRTDRIFEDAALRAVSKWRFEPGRYKGRVIRFKMAVPIVFSLNG